MKEKWGILAGCRRPLTALSLTALALTAFPLQIAAAYTLQNGSLVDAAYVAEYSLEMHYNAAVEAYNREDWREAARQFTIVSTNFPFSPYAKEAFFYQGVVYFNMQEHDCANDAFSSYLEEKNHPYLFLEALEYKYAIAEQLRCGARRRLLGTQKLPKWVSGNSLALQIYDEVIAALPGHQLAVQSLYGKGFLYWSLKDYQKSIESFQLIVRRFPKHELTPECYLLINRVFLDQCRYEFQNPDILAFAQINLRRFEQNFPREERIGEAAADVLAIKEVYAGGLYETGAFYERVCKPAAAAIYYYNVLAQFPETMVAHVSKERLIALGYQLPAAKESPACESES